MRKHGTLKKWNDDRGFGFVSPAQGSEELFVHISAFPKGGERPRLNELLSFETEVGENGKLRAVRIMRAGQNSASSRTPKKRRPKQSSGISGVVFSLLAIAIIGGYGYSRFTRIEFEPPAVQAAATSPARAPPAFECDGRTMCSQMTSCAEAQYFLEHCPGTKMDGDNDGKPCEQQWCN